MTKASLAGGAVAAVLLLIGFVASFRALLPDGERPGAGPEGPAAAAPPSLEPERRSAVDARGFLSGRVTTDGGETYEGRLRWGGGEEAFWGDYFNGEKEDNPWTAHVPPERLVRRRPVEVFGLEILQREEPVDVTRLFMARFGDIALLEASVRQVRVTLKSGTSFVLDRFEAGDFDDGVRVWDRDRGVVDLETRKIRTIELLPTAAAGDLPARLHGTLRTRAGDFTGFVQWDREESVATDELDGSTPDGELGVPFGTLRSIARNGDDGVRATLLDGGEVELSGSREVGDGNRGIYVDDPRYGRVLVSWDAFERIDFSDFRAPDDLRQLGSGPGYDDFPPGAPLQGSVTTRDGRRLAGRLVYDLDESETTETLDAPAEGVDYTIPFGLVAAIALPRGTEGAEGDESHARLTLHGGEELRLELAGDLGRRNLGLLVFAGPGPAGEGGERAEHVPWAEVERIDFDRPPAMYPPLR